ncbi:MAG TPA: serine/threonine-protein kinase, partial [Kofleriaceae bacterium]|nr:serine/threonine-protein kinase [Kofleriaceae bacterium]
MAAAVGRYELVRAIGRGGMAEVFLARRRGAAGIHKRLVVKRVRQDLTSDPRFAEMFLREARVATALSHQNIVTVFDVGRDDEGLFLAMDYVDGPDLAAALERAAAREQTFDPLIAAHIASEVAAGLDYAHRLRDEKGAALGLVHRDVTPRNILLSLGGEVKVTDFGVAVLGSEGSEKRRGTLQYMSPEQARGEPIDARADVFSLGLVLHELLGGERVYRGGKDEILEKARAAVVPRLGGEVPPPLVEAVARATAERPDERFATARAMQRELDAWVVAERGRRGEADPLDHTLAAFLAGLFPDWSERTEEDALKASAGAAGTATMQSVAETVGLDPETASRVQVLTGVRAARQTRPPEAEPPARRGRTIAFAS